MILASFSSIAKSYPSGDVLSGVAGAIKEGERIALLGSNGAGKTTLLEILAGNIEPDTGILEIPKSVRRSYLPQNIKADNSGDLFDYALGGMADLVKLKHRLNNIHHELSLDHDNPGLLTELGRLQDQFETADGYLMESRAKEVLAGLGFGRDEFDKSLKELSGGQRNRAALARILISSPDLLLLDEPTNHLDISGLEFLEGYLKSYGGGVVYVSHDRAFIEATATTVWEMAHGKLVLYSGGYGYYLTEREKRRDSLVRQYEAQREFIEKTEDFIRRNIVGQKTKQAQSRRRMLAKLERLRKPVSSDDTANIKFSGAERSARMVVQADEAGFSYDGGRFLQNLDFEIERGEKIGFFGPNGCGKTTILKLITGRLTPIVGRIEIGKKISIGYYDQLTENLDPESTPLLTIRGEKPAWTEGQIRSYLGRFLFSGEDVFRIIRTFSGGEQSRLALARLIVTEPNFLVLDEPTNHLDIQSREALEGALSEYEGTVLCVSHDRYFLDKFSERIFAIEHGSIRIYLGGYNDYRRKKEKQTPPPRIPERGIRSGEKTAKNSKRRINPQIVQKIENEIAGLETEIASLETRIAELESSSDWQKLTGLLSERDILYSRMENLIAEAEDQTGGI